MAYKKDKLEGFGRATSSERERAEAAGALEMRKVAEKRRAKTAQLKQLRLERDATLPKAKPPARRKAPQSGLNLAQTQRSKKP